MGKRLAVHAIGELTRSTQQAFDLCSDAIICVSAVGEIVSWNAAASAMFGYARQDIVGQPIGVILPDSHADLLARFGGHQWKTGETVIKEGPAKHRDNSSRDTSWHSSPIFDLDGILSGYWIVAHDLSRKRRGDSVRSRLIDCARLVGKPFLDEAVEVLAEALGVRWVLLSEIDHENAGLARTVAYWADHSRQPNIEYLLEGTPCSEVRADRICFIRERVAEQFPDDKFLLDMGIDSYLGVPLRSSKGVLIGLLTVMHDRPIDEQLQPALVLELFAGRAAAEIERLNSSSSAERLGRIVEDAVSEAFIFDAETLKFILVNKGARDNLGYEMDQLRDLTPVDIKPEFEADEFRSLIAPLKSGEKALLSFETIHRRRDGSHYNVTVKLQLLQDLQRPVFYAAVEDTTDRDETVGALQRVTTQLDTILNNTSMGVFLLNDVQECVYMNYAAEALTGFSFSEVKGRVLHDVIHHLYPDGRPFPLEECSIDRAFPENNRMLGEEMFVHKHGHFYPVAYSASPLRDAKGDGIGTVLEIKDITAELEARSARENFNANLKEQVATALEERDAVEAQLRHAQKLEAVGQLTGGIAHDFNNLLQIIGGSLELLDRDVEGNHRAASRVKMARAGVERGAKLAQQLLAYSRKQPLSPKACNLHRLITGLGEMLQRTLGEQIELTITVSPKLWDCFVDESQLENAVLNLAINARDAMSGEGRLAIELSNAVVDEKNTFGNADMVRGEYVVMAVTDNGCGMSSETRERIFEPFFTTKEVGKGTGLGLSTVYGLVKQSGGELIVDSEEGVGTTMTILLPRSLTSSTLATRDDASEIVGGNETILIVEDDDDVRLTVTGLLNELGYMTLKAPNAAAGLAIIQSGIPIDLLFSDVVMPGPLTSHEMSKIAQTLNPNLAVLFTSGYAETGVVRDGQIDPAVNFLSKPYTQKALANKVRQCIDARDSGRNNVPTMMADSEGASDVVRILLVEDEALVAMVASAILSDLGHEVVHVFSGREALNAIESTAFDLIFLDLGLPDMPGEEVATKILDRLPQQRIIVASGHGGARVENITQRYKTTSWLAKPYEQEHLIEALELQMFGNPR